jgi:molecular chaperone DnaK
MEVGIDLGTTKSVIAYWQYGKPHIIPDGSGNLSIPSLVLVTPDEKIYVGRKAQRHPLRYESKNITISSVKRLMGVKGETTWGSWNTYPQEISAFILAELKYQAETYFGDEITDAVIAIPAHFNENNRRATKEAAQIAGFNVLCLVNEAVAATMVYGLDRRNEEKVLVFDLGGGTLDVSVIEIGEGVFEVICVEGDSKLGGDDFDQVIVDYVMRQIYNKYGSDIELNPFQERILKDISERAKIELSSATTAQIRIPGFLNIGNQYYDLDVTLDRRTFESLSEDLFRRAVYILKKALDFAGLGPSDIDALLFLGGSSRIPYFKITIKKEFGLSPFTGVDPETCVAQGAAILAATRKGRMKEALLLDVTPNSYGVGMKGDKFHKIIKKNTTLPTKKTGVFTTIEDNQTAIPIRIYEGESEKASENTYLGTLTLEGIPPARAGTIEMEVTFDIDANGIVHASAKDTTLGDGKDMTVRVDSPYRLNEVQLRTMRRNTDTWLLERRLEKTVFE